MRALPILAATALALVALPVAAEGPRGRAGMRPGVGTANPAALVATEIAFARAAREKGQWTAFREFGDADAVMFVPQPVLAQDWLKGRKDPAAAVQWQAHQVWISCDGSAGVTRGAWQRPDGSVGWFTTIWKRRKKGDYRWVLDQGDVLPAPLEQPDMLSAQVGECPARRGGPPPGDRPAAVADADAEPAPARLRQAGMEGRGESDDGSLDWRWQVGPDMGRTLSVSLRKHGAMAEVLSVAVAVAGEGATR